MRIGPDDNAVGENEQRLGEITISSSDSGVENSNILPA